MIHEDYLNALKALEKAQILYPSERNKYLLFSNLVTILDKGLKKDDDGKYLGKLSQYSSDNNTLDYIESKFELISRELTINHPNLTVYKKFSADLFHNLRDTSLISKCKVTHHSLIGYYYYSNSDYLSSLNELAQAIEINRENI